MENKYRSRKWLLTSGICAFCALAIWHGKMDSKDVALVFIAGIGAYNLANAWLTK